MSQEKKKRNDLIYAMREEDGMSFIAIGKLFELDRTTVADIFYRECRRRGNWRPKNSSVYILPPSGHSNFGKVGQDVSV